MQPFFKFGDAQITTIEYASRGNAVLGIRDSGKSYTSMGLAEHLMDAGIPITSFDVTGTWRFLRVPSPTASNAKGYPVVVIGGADGDLPLSLKTAPDMIRAAMAAGVSVVVDLFSPEWSKADWKAVIVACVHVLLYENKAYGLRHIFLEEAAEFIPQKVGRDMGRIYAEMEKLARWRGPLSGGRRRLADRSGARYSAPTRGSRIFRFRSAACCHPASF